MADGSQITRRINSEKIKLSPQTEYQLLGEDGEILEETLSDLGKLNIFIGKNNAGKSRLLRSLFSDDFSFTTDPINYLPEEIITLVGAIIKEVQDSGYTNVIDHQNTEVIEQVLSIMNKKEFLLKGPLDRNPTSRSLSAILGRELSISHNNRQSRIIPQSTRAIIQDKNLKNPDELISYVMGSLIDFEKIYIPTLRGVRRINEENDAYKRRTKEDYFNNINIDKLEIFTGQDINKTFVNLLLGDHEERANAAEFEKFLSDNFFTGQDVSIIPKTSPSIEAGIPYIKIGNDEFPIHELGDGIQAILILTLPFFSKRHLPAMGFIEEPELNLHPGMQRILIKAIHQHLPNHQFFITSHSPALLDLTMEYDDISVFDFRKNESQKVTEIRKSSYGDLSLLNILGCRNSSLFLSNCTIWIEGVSDRIYIQRILSTYIASNNLTPYSEDLHYSFVEYSGGNIVHWSFLDEPDSESLYTKIKVQRLCGSAFLITDSDDERNQVATGNPDEDSAKASRIRNFKSKLGDRFFNLPCREIENLLTPEVLDLSVREFCKIRHDFQHPPYTLEDYRDEPLGEFLDEKYSIGKKPGIGKAIKSKNSKTISDKLSFAIEAISHINTSDDLSEDSLELAGALHRFISECNK